MNPTIKNHHARRLVRLATAFDRDGGDDEVTFELPEDLTELSDEDLGGLLETATELADDLYDPDGDISAEDVELLQRLADAAEAIRGEQTRREEERESNRQRAEEAARRIRPEDSSEEDDDEDEEGDESRSSDDGDESSESEGDEALAAAAAARRRITLSGVRGQRGGSRRRSEPAVAQPQIVANADLGGQLAAGDNVTIDQVADQLLRRTQGMTDSSYRNAYTSGRRQRQAIGLLSVVKNFPDELVASADNGQEVLELAVSQSRLPGESLLASGGWCSPSQTIYDLFEIESADGLVSVPEFQVIRGGIRHTQGPDFSTLYANTGFTFTEDDDAEGNYAEGGEAGDKPCYKVDCPDFVDDRLQVTGLCITAGILQNRAYPEVTARTIRGALTGHQHRLAAQTITAMAGHDETAAVAMPADQVGALAPILTSIELQAMHYRYVHRMSDNAVLEAIFPRWVRGLIRSDLSRRLGVDLLAVPNSRVTQWFNERGISPQFVYNYQDLTGGAAAFTAWPSEVKFMLYAAGTWARGSSDVISLDAIFDSALLAQNDFTALFSEEGWLLAKRGHDSREVTVPVCGDGATHGGVLIDCNGAAVDEGGEG